MAQTLIEKLEALPRYAHDIEGMVTTDVPYRCLWVNIHSIRAIIEQAKVEPQPTPQIPEGYVLVPIEPTEEMFEAGFQAGGLGGDGDEWEYASPIETYKAMIQVVIDQAVKGAND